MLSAAACGSVNDIRSNEGRGVVRAVNFPRGALSLPRKYLELLPLEMVQFGAFCNILGHVQAYVCSFYFS